MAAKNVTNSELETLLGDYANQHGRFHAELNQEATRLGGTASNEGTFGGSLYRGWIDLKSALTGHSAKTLLTSCEGSEQSAEVAYDDAIEAYPSGQTHTLILKQRKEIAAFCTRLARLVGKMKDGTDFQKNE